MSRTIVRFQQNKAGEPLFQLDSAPRTGISNARVPRPLLDFDPTKPPFNQLTAGLPGLVSQLASGAPGVVRLVGEVLYALLTKHPAVASAFQYVQQVPPNDAQCQPLYIDLRDIEIDLIESLPWEVLYFPIAQRFPALTPYWPVGRIADTSMGVDERQRDCSDAVRLLAVVAAADVPGDAEWDSLWTAVQAVPTANVAVRVLTADDVVYNAVTAAAVPGRLRVDAFQSCGQLRSVLRDWKPHVVHFFCHGVAGTATACPSLQLATRATALLPASAPDRRIETLTAQDLLDVAEWCHECWLVVLNCCSGAEVRGSMSLARRLVAGGVPAAMAMRQQIRPADVPYWTAPLYRGLLPLVAAIQAAPPGGSAGGLAVEWPALLYEPRQALLARYRDPALPGLAEESHPEWSLPVVYVRPEPFRLHRPRPARDSATVVRLQAKLDYFVKIRAETATGPQPNQALLADLDACIAALIHQLSDAP